MDHLMAERNNENNKESQMGHVTHTKKILFLVWHAPFGCLYYFHYFFLPSSGPSFHLVYRWIQDSNLRPRTMHQIASPRRSLLDQGASLPKKSSLPVYFNWHPKFWSIWGTFFDVTARIRSWSKMSLGQGMFRIVSLRKVCLELCWNLKYSKTSVQRPPSGPQNSGRCWQVIVVRGRFYSKGPIWDLKMVIAVDRWSLFGSGC